MAKDKKLLFCSFCGKNQEEVQKLIAGPSVHICNACVALCEEMLGEEEQVEETEEAHHLPKPHEIKSYLDAYVIGQETYQKSLGSCSL